MHKWNFSVATTEKGRINFTVTASDKQTAIKKGFEKLAKKNLSYGNTFVCTLVR